MVDFKFSCPHCGVRIECDLAYAGLQVNCPACKRLLVVPNPGTPTSPVSVKPPPGPASVPGAVHAAAGSSAQKKGKPAVILVVGAVIVIAIAAVAFVLLSKNPSKTEAAGNGGIIVASSKESQKLSALWTEGFESGLNQWTAVPQADALNDDTTRAITGTKSARVVSSRDKMYRDIGSELDGPARLTFWLFDGTQGRVFGEIRAYSGGGYGAGVVRQGFAAGCYNSGFGTGVGNLMNEVVNPKKYQGRVLAGANEGWFNLDAPNAPSRSTGWHKFEIERATDGTTVHFYVDGVLGRTITDTTAAALNTVVIGSLGQGNAAGDAWFDDIKLESGSSGMATASASSTPKK